MTPKSNNFMQDKFLSILKQMSNLGKINVFWFSPMLIFILKMVGLLFLEWLNVPGAFVYNPMPDITQILPSIETSRLECSIFRSLKWFNTEPSRLLVMSCATYCQWDIAKLMSAWWMVLHNLTRLIKNRAHYAPYAWENCLVISNLKVRNCPDTRN